MSYTILKNSKQLVSDDMTIEEFKDWFLYSEDYEKWIEDQQYRDAYAIRKFRKIMKNLSISSQSESNWLNYTFIKNKELKV